MIINQSSLTLTPPIRDMESEKKVAHGMSYGLSEVGYDIRVKQRVEFVPPDPIRYAELVQTGQHHWTDEYYRQLLKETFYGYVLVGDDGGPKKKTYGRMALASTVEEFHIPTNLWGELRNKSSLVRQFVDATHGTDMEPGWCGWLTLEIRFDGIESVVLEAGSPIAKAVFHELRHDARYTGKYQNQADKPQEAIRE